MAVQLNTVLASIMLFWSSLYLIHVSLRSSSRFAFRYLSLLDRLGLSLHVAQARCYTTRCNRLFIRLAQCRSRLWSLWFGVGAFCGVILSVVSAVILASVLHDGIWKRVFDASTTTDDAVESMTSGDGISVSDGAPSSASDGAKNPTTAKRFSSSSSSNRLMTPVLPGVNLPWNQTGYYLFTLFVCGLLHEVGHAVAANCHNIRVNGFGFFVALCYPGAFVDLNADSLRAANPWHQLKVYCAGVWHNVVIVVAAVLHLQFSASVLFPFYSTGGGAVVSGVLPDSVISGKRGLHIGDVVTKVGDCHVGSTADWNNCLSNLTTTPVHDIPGYCVPVGYIMQHRQKHRPRRDEPGKPRLPGEPAAAAAAAADDDVSIDSATFPDCCGVNATNKDLCFSYRSKDSVSALRACLPARSVSERPSCRVNADCAGGRRVKADVAKSVCVFPTVGNRTRLLRILRPPAPTILFLGNPLELRFTVGVIDFRRRFRFLPVNAPPVIELCCKYLASLSGALALLNVVPCYALDGQHILASVLDIFLPGSHVSKSVKEAVNNCLLILGSFLLLMNVFLAFYNLR